MLDKNQESSPVIAMLKKIKVLLVNNFKYLILLVLLAIFSAGYWFLLQPKYLDIKNSASELQAVRQIEYENLQQYYKELVRYKASFDKIDADSIKRMDSMVPTGLPDESLFASLEKLVLSQGLILAKLEINNEVPKTKAADSKTVSQVKMPVGLGVARIKMDIAGTDYQSLKNFLSKLEKNLKIMDVREIKFSPQQKSASLAVDTYYLK